MNSICNITVIELLTPSLLVSLRPESQSQKDDDDEDVDDDDDNDNHDDGIGLGDWFVSGVSAVTSSTRIFNNVRRRKTPGAPGQNPCSPRSPRGPTEPPFFATGFRWTEIVPTKLRDDESERPTDRNGLANTEEFLMLDVSSLFWTKNMNQARYKLKMLVKNFISFLSHVFFPVVYFH